MGFYLVIHLCNVMALFTQKMKGMGSMIQFTYSLCCGLWIQFLYSNNEFASFLITAGSFLSFPFVVF
jgi:hypothetical protein